MNQKNETLINLEKYILQEINKHIGAIEALNATYQNLVRKHEQEAKKEDEAGAESGASTHTAGNGYAYQNSGSETKPEA